MDFQTAKSYILDRLERELSPDLHYHDLRHTLDVLHATLEIAESEAIYAERELILLQTAALFHDSGFLINNTNHEQLGCKLVKAQLPAFGYDKDGIEQICGMIMATQIPQSPTNKLEAIICDADLDYLGRDDFEKIGDMLFKELKAYRVLQTRAEWDAMQVKFLSKHQYFTATNQERRRPGKLRALARLES